MSTLAHSLKVLSIMVGKSLRQRWEASGPIASVAQRQRAMVTGVQFLSYVPCSLRP